MAFVTIPSGGTDSNLFLLGDYRFAGIQCSAAWDAASISFKTSHDGLVASLGSLYTHPGDSSAGAQVVIPAAAIAAGRPIAFVDLLMVALASARAIQLIASATQNADRIIGLLLEPR